MGDILLYNIRMTQQFLSRVLKSRKLLLGSSDVPNLYFFLYNLQKSFRIICHFYLSPFPLSTVEGKILKAQPHFSSLGIV